MLINKETFFNITALSFSYSGITINKDPFPHLSMFVYNATSEYLGNFPQDKCS